MKLQRWWKAAVMENLSQIDWRIVKAFVVLKEGFEHY